MISIGFPYMRRYGRRHVVKDIALQRILKLLKYALNVVKCDPVLARRYVSLALRISKRNRVKIPHSLKLLYCKKCYTPLLPGITARVRIRTNRFSHISITCLHCGAVKRKPLKLKCKAHGKRLGTP